MADLADAGSEIEGKISGFGKDFGWLTGSAAFVIGVTSKYNPMITSGLSFTQSEGYPFNYQGIGDFVKQVSGIGLPGWSGGAQQTFNPGAAFNKETGIAVGLYILEEVWPNKHTRTLKNLLFPPFLGYGLGKVFDDPPYKGGSGPGGGTIVAHQFPNPSGSNTGRAFAVKTGVPWTA